MKMRHAHRQAGNKQQGNEKQGEEIEDFGRYFRVKHIFLFSG